MICNLQLPIAILKSTPNANEGTIFPRFKLVDQFGENVDLYDFALNGRLIILELSTAWCQPCRNLASWMTFGDLKVTQSRMWRDEYSVIKSLIDEDRVYFINIQLTLVFYLLLPFIYLPSSSNC